MPTLAPRLYLIALVSIANTVSCASQGDANKALFRRTAEELFVKRDVSAVDRYYADHYVQHNAERAALARKLGISDREQTKVFFGGFFIAFPDLTIAIDHLYAEDDKVFAVVTWRGTHQGPFMGMPPTGQPMLVQTADIFRVEDGRFVEHWDVVDATKMFPPSPASQSR